MSKAEVKKFNVVAGNAPSQGDLWECWKQIRSQVEFLREEVMEGVEAAQQEDMQEIIDAWADIWYVNTYLGQLLEAFGVDTKAVINEVCKNNSQKYTTSFSYAKESQECLENKGAECYIESTYYEGTDYFTVRRKEDGKVLKLKHHERPDISKFVPKEFK